MQFGQLLLLFLLGVPFPDFFFDFVLVIRTAEAGRLVLRVEIVATARREHQRYEQDVQATHRHRDSPH